MLELGIGNSPGEICFEQGINKVERNNKITLMVVLYGEQEKKDYFYFPPAIAFDIALVHFFSLSLGNTISKFHF